MEWLAAKLGSPMLDAVEAFGLGRILAYVTHSPIVLADEGLMYRLSSSIKILPKIDSSYLLEAVLALPTIAQLQLDSNNLLEADDTFSNMDGLLAALFTIPGKGRLVSVADLLVKQKYQPSTAQEGLDKVTSAISRWRKYISKKSPQISNWLSEALQDYSPLHPKVPSVHPVKDMEISISMTIDPGFSYANYRPLSDGLLLTGKTNTTIRGPVYAPLLAYVGAAGLLRAQRVANKLVNFYVPLPNLITIYPRTRLPILSQSPLSADQAALYQCLRMFTRETRPGLQWKGLAFQTLQTQGNSQSISVKQGYLDHQSLKLLKQRLGPSVINWWTYLLSYQPRELPFELDDLMNCLLRYDQTAWFNHLYSTSIAVMKNDNENRIRTYTLKEVKEVAKLMMVSKNTQSLSAVFDRNEGTIRFGRALRSLSLVNKDALFKIIDELESVSTSDQLLRIAGLIGQECEIAKAENKANSKFVIVPNRHDLRYFVDDIQQYGPRTVANLLISLAFVRNSGAKKRHPDKEVQV